MSDPVHPAPTAPALSMWVIYDHPKDEPDQFVARRWLMRAGQMIATRETITCQTITSIRGYLAGSQLRCFPRSPGDDPCIVEIWL